MSEPIIFDYQGTTYTLEFNRRTASLAEMQYGINLLDTKGSSFSITQSPDLFYCALLMHHPRIRRDVSDGIYDCLADKAELVGALLELLFETVSTVIEEPDEGNAISWKRAK